MDILVWKVGVADTQAVNVAEQEQPLTVVICLPRCAMRSYYMFQALSVIVITA